MRTDKEEVVQLVMAAFKRAISSQSDVTEEEIEEISRFQTSLIFNWGKNHTELRLSLVAVIVIGSTFVNIPDWEYDERALLHIFAFQQAIVAAEIQNHLFPFTAAEAKEIEIHRKMLYKLLDRIDTIEAEIRAESSKNSFEKDYVNVENTIDSPREIVKVILYTIGIAAAIYLFYRYFPS